MCGTCELPVDECRCYDCPCCGEPGACLCEGSDFEFTESQYSRDAMEKLNRFVEGDEILF